MLNLYDLQYVGRAELKKIDLSKFTEHQLRNALQTWVEFSEDNWYYLGLICKELQARKVDLSEFKKGIGQFIILIGEQKLHPGIALRFSGRPTLLSRIAKLGPKIQTKILQKEKFDFAKWEHGKIIKTSIEIDTLNCKDNLIFFDKERIRPFEEQRDILIKHYSPRKKIIAPSIRIRYDSDSKLLRIQNTNIPLNDLYKFLSAQTGKTITEISKFLNFKVSN